MDLNLTQNDRDALIQIFTGKQMRLVCQETNTKYWQISDYKNLLFPALKCHRKFEHSEAEATELIDKAIESYRAKPAKQIPENLFSETPEPESKPESKLEPRMINLGPLERMDKALFNHVIKVAHAAMTWENARNLFKGTM